MKWNYRVIAHINPFNLDEIGLQIHEVFYNKNMKPKAFSETPAMIGGDSIEDILWTLNEIKLCLEKPILSAKNFPNKINVKT